MDCYLSNKIHCSVLNSWWMFAPLQSQQLLIHTRHTDWAGTSTVYSHQVDRQSWNEPFTHTEHTGWAGTGTDIQKQSGIAAHLRILSDIQTLVWTSWNNHIGNRDWTAWHSYFQSVANCVIVGSVSPYYYSNKKKFQYWIYESMHWTSGCMLLLND